MTREDLKNFDVPDTPGVYFFVGKKGKILYIGKATSLRDRVRSYFASDLAGARSPAIVSMVELALTLKWQTTDSVLEALILEANLIKRHQPQYNVDEKDNKSWNYLVLTKEEFPRLLVIRGRELFDANKKQDWKSAKIFGPYPQGGALREAIKIVRKIFPYRDTCTPQVGKPCFNAQIGLCPGVCGGAVSKTEYKKTIRNITELFSGKMPSLRKRLTREMKSAADGEKFEEANTLRRQVSALTHIRDVSLIKAEHRVAPGGSIRIEAYDTAHTGGTETVGVMTVVQDGEAQKAAYRKFKINTVTNDDPGALREILERRLAHTEWTYPRLIVVDGGTTQLRAAQRVLTKAGVSIPIVAVVKDDRHKARGILGDNRMISAHERDILLANAEAHRYAIGWHRMRSRRRLTN